MRSPSTMDTAINEAHVVILSNYLRRHHVLVFEEIQKRVGKLTVLLSTDMEPDRDWQAQWGALNVVMQSSWMYTAKWKHSSGFKEPNFIHIPLDTVSRLKKLNPDIVFSYEMGMRTLFSGRYCRSANVPLVMVGNMAEHVERERGTLRRLLRRLIVNSIDYATYNGPGCRRYLSSLKIPDERLFHFPYAYDPSKVYTGAKEFSQGEERKLLYCGALGERKGILGFTEVLQRYAQEIPTCKIRFSIAGDGPHREQVAAFAQSNLIIDFLGNCSPEQLSGAYRDSDICVFPTLADEWGLVPIEAMKSGTPVLGSIAAQSIETFCVDDENGWVFDPTESEDVYEAIERAFAATPDRLMEMGESARASVETISARSSADEFMKILSGTAESQMHSGQESMVHATERSLVR